ncbi:hypothetical protein [Maricaulis salignorans]|uniref:hypothetical protein n=1 Tax=Maricaulis salignorans TaxID=144026 RepID=UPI00115F97F9|nr:hypothetical protein [Maricaulis salignorans]
MSILSKKIIGVLDQSWGSECKAMLTSAVSKPLIGVAVYRGFMATDKCAAFIERCTNPGRPQTLPL